MSLATMYKRARVSVNFMPGFSQAGEETENDDGEDEEEEEKKKKKDDDDTKKTEKEKAEAEAEEDKEDDDEDNEEYDNRCQDPPTVHSVAPLTDRDMSTATRVLCERVGGVRSGENIEVFLVGWNKDTKRRARQEAWAKTFYSPTKKN